MIGEMEQHLIHDIIPFWESLRDEQYGGYYGQVDFNHQVHKEARKGCILNSRILWFFSNAYSLLGEAHLLEDARHAFEFLRDHCIDREYGGVYWSLEYEGSTGDSLKHTYNQAFAIYALSSYYEASKENEALRLAWELFDLIEERCTDEVGYLEAFDRKFMPADNEQLSENGIIADKTMNTLLHVLEAYTELYRVTGTSAGEASEKSAERVAGRIRFILDTVAEKIYNPRLRRQEVFFDREFNSLIDLHSYGHDIEASWLIDRAWEVLRDKGYEEKMRPITADLAARVYERAYVDHSVLNECEKGTDDTWRIWWVQGESVVGFLNQYQKDPARQEYLEAARDIWGYIQEKQIDRRSADGAEWFWRVDDAGNPDQSQNIADSWKCPYHNGRMCIEVIRRMGGNENEEE